MALESIKQTLVEQTTRLRTIGTVKTPAVVHMHGVVDTLRQDVERILDETTESWTNALDTQIAEPLALAHNQFDTSDHFFLGFSKVVPFLQLVVFMITVCHVVLRLPRRGTVWMFQMCSKIITAAFSFLPSIPHPIATILDKFPVDIGTTMKPLCLEGKSLVYASCPKCHAIYRPKFPDDKAGNTSKVPVYPLQCDAVWHGVLCEELLVRPKSIGTRRLDIYVPIRPYVVFDFKD
ncbi:hypothetical protein C0993_000442, partial [Termitomyces sp. T159_Od127]